MASIMKRGDSYSVRYKYKDHSGKPCEGWESFKTKKEAQERKITVEKELLDGTFLVPDTMTVEEMLYKWIPIQSTKHKWSPKTYTQSVAMVQNLIVPYIGKRKVQELRTYDIEKFYATLAKTPCGQYVHGEGQPGVQRVIHDQRLAPGQPLAGGGQHAGQPRHDAAHNNALTGGGVHRQAPQQKFHLGGVLVLGAAEAGDHAGRERNGAVVRPVQPANADVGVADVNC